MFAARDRLIKIHMPLLVDSLQTLIESNERHTQQLLTLIGQLDQHDAQLAEIERIVQLMQASSRVAQERLELATVH